MLQFPTCLSTPGGQMVKIEFSSYLECPLLLTLWTFFVILLNLGSFRLIFAPRAVSGTLHTFKPQKWNICGKFTLRIFFLFFDEIHFSTLWSHFCAKSRPSPPEGTWRFSRFWVIFRDFEHFLSILSGTSLRQNLF